MGTIRFPKSEMRSTESETRTKFQLQMTKTILPDLYRCSERTARFPVLSFSFQAFEFVSYFAFLISAFLPRNAPQDRETPLSTRNVGHHSSHRLRRETYRATLLPEPLKNGEARRPINSCKDSRTRPKQKSRTSLKPTSHVRHFAGGKCVRLIVYGCRSKDL